MEKGAFEHFSKITIKYKKAKTFKFLGNYNSFGNLNCHFGVSWIRNSKYFQKLPSDISSLILHYWNWYVKLLHLILIHFFAMFLIHPHVSKGTKKNTAKKLVIKNFLKKRAHFGKNLIIDKKNCIYFLVLEKEKVEKFR